MKGKEAIPRPNDEYWKLFNVDLIKRKSDLEHLDLDMAEKMMKEVSKSIPKHASSNPAPLIFHNKTLEEYTFCCPGEIKLENAQDKKIFFLEKVKNIYGCCTTPVGRIVFRGVKKDQLLKLLFSPGADYSDYLLYQRLFYFGEKSQFYSSQVQIPVSFARDYSTNPCFQQPRRTPSCVPLGAVSAAREGETP